MLKLSIWIYIIIRWRKEHVEEMKWGLTTVKHSGITLASQTNHKKRRNVNDSKPFFCHRAVSSVSLLKFVKFAWTCIKFVKFALNLHQICQICKNSHQIQALCQTPTRQHRPMVTWFQCQCSLGLFVAGCHLSNGQLRELGVQDTGVKPWGCWVLDWAIWPSKGKGHSSGVYYSRG